MKHWILSLFTLFSFSVFAQTSVQYSVLVEASVNTSESSITISWDEDPNASQYILYRKNIDSFTWGSPVTTTTSLTYTDTSVSTGVQYDYRVSKSASGYNGIGYVRAGMEIELPSDRGEALIIVESSIAAAIPASIEELVSDFEGEGYRTYMITVDTDTSVGYVKGVIEQMNDSLDDLEMLYLVGHVPVPYSGNLAPDGHVPDHRGAWPADVYYGDFDGNWTDNSINNTGANDPRNDNVPGDGKFDISIMGGSELPELMVGRVDFANLSHFSQTEIELTEAYLNRVHAYKMGEWSLEKRALIDDNFGGFGGEAFASNGWRNFAPLIGKDQITSSDYRSTMANEGYLFSYGCGGGSHESANGIGTSSQLAGDSLSAGFTMLFGSYFGDWDRPNNFMRSALAQGRTMSISWAGRPWWYYHPMGLGESLGYCARLTQSNTGTYQTSYGGRFVHVAQLGDPSLRMEYIGAPNQLSADTLDTFDVSLQWTANADTTIDGYRVHRRMNGGDWQVLANRTAQTGYIDLCVDSGVYEYRVTSVKLVESASGTYWNESIGIMDTVQIFQSKVPTVQVSAEQTGFNETTIQFTSETTWSDDIIWLFPDTTVVGVDSFIATIGQTGSTNPPYNDGVDYQVVVFNHCFSDTIDAYASAAIGGVDDVLKTRVKVFPNPIRKGETLTIELEGRHTYQVYDVQGRVVSLGAIQEKTIALDAVPPGTYLLIFDDIEGAIPIVVMP